MISTNQYLGCNVDDDDFPNNILTNNDYQENVHVIERCDDDGFTSDSVFCSDSYFYVNSYNNDRCNNEGIYAAQYSFEGCNDDLEYLEIMGCDKDSGLSANNQSEQGLETWGVIFIVLALIALVCSIAFVTYHCRRSRNTFDITE